MPLLNKKDFRPFFIETFELQSKVFSVNSGSKTNLDSVKIEEVYDSTAIASIYKKKDPNIILRVGDIVKY